MPQPFVESTYPEYRFGGFTRYDGTVHFYSRVRALLGEDDVILNVGCGLGSYQQDVCEYRRDLRNMMGANRTVIGIDIDSAADANPLVDEFRLIEDVNHWPVEDTSVDLVLADYVLEHVENPEQFFREAWRVMKTGSYFCARTPNAFSYVALIARIIPNRFHAQVTAIAQATRREEVVPTVYRCNSKSKLRRLLRRQGFDHVVYRIEPEPAYMLFSRAAFRVAAIVHRFLPPFLQSTLLMFARKVESEFERADD